MAATEATGDLLASVLSLSTWLKGDERMPADLIISLGLVQRLCRESQHLIALHAIRIAQLPPTPSPSPSSYSSPTVDTVIVAATTCIRGVGSLLERYQTWTPADRAIFNGSSNEVRRLLAEVGVEMRQLQGDEYVGEVDSPVGKGKGIVGVDGQVSGEGRLSCEPTRSFDNVDLLQGLLSGAPPRVQNVVVPGPNTKAHPSPEQRLDREPTPPPLPPRPPKVPLDGSHLGTSGAPAMPVADSDFLDAVLRPLTDASAAAPLPYSPSGSVQEIQQAQHQYQPDQHHQASQEQDSSEMPSTLAARYRTTRPAPPTRPAPTVQRKPVLPPRRATPSDDVDLNPPKPLEARSIVTAPVSTSVIPNVSSNDAAHRASVSFTPTPGSTSTSPNPRLHQDPLRSHPVSLPTVTPSPPPVPTISPPPPPPPPVSVASPPPVAPLQAPSPPPPASFVSPPPPTISPLPRPVSFASPPPVADPSPLSGMAALFAASQTSIRTAARQSMMPGSLSTGASPSHSPIPDRHSFYSPAQPKRQTLPVTHSFPAPGQPSPPPSYTPPPSSSLAVAAPSVSPPQHLHPIGPTSAPAPLPHKHTSYPPPTQPYAQTERPNSQASTKSASSLPLPAAQNLHASSSAIGLAALFGATSPPPLVQTPPPAAELPGHGFKAPIELAPVELPTSPIGTPHLGLIAADGSPIHELDSTMIYRKVLRPPVNSRKGMVCSPSKLYMVATGESVTANATAASVNVTAIAVGDAEPVEGETMSAGGVLETVNNPVEQVDAPPVPGPLQRVMSAEQGQEWLSRTQMLQTRRVGLPMKRVVPESA